MLVFSERLTDRTMGDLVKLFKALSDPTRLEILVRLSDGDLCVGALAYRLGVTHSAVSQHLRVLREAGLVEGQRRGPRVHYAVRREQVRAASEQVSEWLSRLGAQPDERGAAGAVHARRARPRRVESAARR